MRPRWLAEITAGIAQLVFPNSCLICDEPERDRNDFRHGLCIDCHRAITLDPVPVCRLCGSSLPAGMEAAEQCGRCGASPHDFREVIRLGPYDGRLREAVLRIKHEAGEALAEMLGRVFADIAAARVRAAGAEVVVPVPLHWRRAWRRGHNQAASIARELAFAVGLPFAPRALKRVRYTPQQLQPSAAARRENVRGAFQARQGAQLDGKRILLVDDVMTTGSTADEAALTLKKAGASSVVVAILARR